MRKAASFFSIAVAASARQANRTRREFIGGSMTAEQFREVREKQDRAAGNRIETVLARTIPHYRPNFTQE